MWTGAPLPCGIAGPVGLGDGVGVGDSDAVGGATEVLALLLGGTLVDVVTVGTRAVQPATTSPAMGARAITAAKRRRIRGEPFVGHDAMT